MLEKFLRKVVNTLKKYEFILEGLDCANCANKIQDKLAENENYINVNVNFNTLKLTFESELEVHKEDIVYVVKLIEPDVEILTIEESKKHTSNCGHDHNHEHNHEHEHEKKECKLNKNVWIPSAT